MQASEQKIEYRKGKNTEKDQQTNGIEQNSHDSELSFVFPWENRERIGDLIWLTESEFKGVTSNSRKLEFSEKKSHV